MNLQRSRIGLLPTLSLCALTIVTAVSCARVFANWDFLPLLLGVALATHGIMALARAFRVPLIAATPVAALVAGGLIARHMYEATVRFGFIPTRSTWNLGWLDLRDAWRQFPSAIAPVPSSNGFLLGAALAIFVVAYTSDTFGFRAFGRVEAVIPSGVLFTFVAALGEEGNKDGRIWSSVAWLFTACVSVALLRNAHGDLGNTWLGGKRRDRAIRIAVAAAALSLVTVSVAYAVAPNLPGAGEPALIDPGESDGSSVNVVSPIVDIRARLVNRGNRVLFTVTADKAAYWHLTSLPQFDGTQWESSNTFSKASGELGTSPLAGGEVLEQTFTIEQMGGGWVPAAHEAVAVETTDDFVYNQETGTLRVAGDADLRSGMTYSVTSVLANFTRDELQGASSALPPSPEYTELPDDFPNSLREAAADIVQDAATPYEIARALQDYFQTNFTYDVNVPRGHSEDAIETFLNQKRGYCEQFAGTFAALGRALGIPTRVAIGFTPGVVEDGEFVVRGRNAHAWPEVWFDDFGWVPFEPTPGRGAPGATDYTGLAPAQDTGVGADTGTDAGNGSNNPTATTAPRVTQVPDNRDPGLLFPEPSGNSSSTPPSSGGSGLPVVPLLLIGVVLLAVAWFVAMPRLSAALTRRRRGHSPADRITTAWREAVLALGVLGAGRKDTETPMEHADRAWKLTGIDHNSLRSLANAATRAVYASDILDDRAADESERLRREVAERVRARASWSTRFKARMNPKTAHAFR